MDRSKNTRAEVTNAYEHAVGKVGNRVIGKKEKSERKRKQRTILLTTQFHLSFLLAVITALIVFSIYR